MRIGDSSYRPELIKQTETFQNEKSKIQEYLDLSKSFFQAAIDKMGRGLDAGEDIENAKEFLEEVRKLNDQSQPIDKDLGFKIGSALFEVQAYEMAPMIYHDPEEALHWRTSYINQGLDSLNR